MSKIAEIKALEAYPICNCYNDEHMRKEDVNIELRIGYEEGYDQAMQDFLEKACEWLMHNNDWHDGEVDLYVKNFKNYMQNESEN